MANPTKYKEGYCKDIIKHMEEGYSLQSFAGTINISPCTLNEWQKKHPDFKDAVEQGKLKGLLFWEKAGILGAKGRIPGFNVATWIFTMKNRFGWRDKKDIEHTGKDGGPMSITALIKKVNTKDS